MGVSMMYRTGAVSRRLRLGAAAAALLPVVLASTPTFAQKGPGGGQNVIDEGYNFCLDAVAGLDYLRESLTAAGWTIDDDADYGPYQTYINASLIGNEATAAKYLYATLEQYPTIDLVYCTFEVEGAYATPDFDLLNDYGLDGEYQTLNDGTYGVWEIADDTGGQLWLLQAQQDYLYFQLDWIGPGYRDGPATGAK
ncbi:MAG: hypothetical protein KIS68_12975 [Bauldia sp.]|nr:hypothetical protein [Bauldia sp.]